MSYKLNIIARHELQTHASKLACLFQQFVDTSYALATTNASVAGRTISVPLDGSPLAAVGSAAIVRTALGNFLVARTAPETFTALTAVCTHEGNPVANFTGSQFVCPTHGSQFNLSGTVAQGPATRPLTTYPTTLAGGVVSFSV